MDRSFFAKEHPLTGFLYIVAVLLVTMITLNPVIILVSLIMASVNVIVLGGIKKYISFFVPGLFVLIFTVGIQPLFSQAGSTPLFYMNDNPVTMESYIYGVAIGVLLMSVMLWCGCIRLILDGDKLMYLSGKCLPTLGLTFSMILRFVPLMRERFIQIHEAQLGMGRTTEKMGLPAKIGLLVRELSILISWSLEASMETSISMEARGYGQKRRTSYHLYRFRAKDVTVCVGIVVLAVTIVVLIVGGGADMYYLPKVIFTGNVWSTGIAAGVFTVLASIPLIYEIRGVVKWHYLNLKM